MARQPLLIAYLIAGFAIGPHGFRFVTDPDSIRTISEIGLALLLFMIGLEMDLKKMLGSGRVITVTALAQITGCVAIGWIFQPGRADRGLNPGARIIMHAERIADVAAFYDEGLSYVITPRLLEASELLGVLDAAEHDLDTESRRGRQESPGDRREVVP